MNDQKPVDEAVITYADFVLICQVEDDEDFGGFVVKPDGVYVKAFDKRLLALLSPEERHELLWHPTGRYDKPALPLPCSLPELRSFEDEAGLAGSIDEDLLAEVLAAKRKNHTEQPTRPAPAIKPASKAPPPTTPVRARAPYCAPRRPAGPPDWDFWRLIPNVALWQFCAMSLNLEPDQLEIAPDGWMSGPGGRLSFEPWSFPSNELAATFDKRYRILDAQSYRAIGRDNNEVSFAACAAWAMSVGWEIPTELRELAASGDVREQAASNAPRANHQAAPEVTAADDTEQADIPPRPPSDSDHEDIASLFDPVRVATLEALFPDGGKWAGYAERAARNGLRDAAKAGDALFNPYHAAVWWFARGRHGWKWERCKRVLANNLPPRSRDSKHLLTGDLD